MNDYRVIVQLDNARFEGIVEEMPSVTYVAFWTMHQFNKIRWNDGEYIESQSLDGEEVYHLSAEALNAL